MTGLAAPVDVPFRSYETFRNYRPVANFRPHTNLLKKRDRIAIAKYELSRDFGVQDKPVCGNMLMFDCPDGTPPLENIYITH